MRRIKLFASRYQYLLNDGLMLAAILVVLLHLLSGCTIYPRQVVYGTVSYVNNVRDSGMKGRDGVTGLEIVDGQIKDRYDAMLAIYGSKYAPVPKADVGFTAFTNGTYLLDNQHLHIYLQMCVWKRSGR